MKKSYNIKNERIVYINGRFLTQKVTGVQRYATEVIKQLDKIDTNIKFIILTPKTKDVKILDLNNIEVIQIGKLKGHMWEQISLPLYIFIHNKKAKLLNMCNLAPVLKPEYVVIHDILFKIHPEYFSRLFSSCYRLITMLNIKRYNHIFTVSNFSKKEIMKNYKINDEKITVAYNSANHFKDILDDKNIINNLELREKEYYFALGSKSPHKNHKYIIECAKRNPESLFVLSGNANSKIFKEEKQESKIKNIIYTGELTDEEIKTLYKRCKAFIYPSYYEGFGLPPLEAITAGCDCIILSDIEVFKEIYGDSAQYIQLSKLEYNIDKKVDENKRINKEELLKKYSWEKVAKVIEKEICKTEGITE